MIDETIGNDLVLGIGSKIDSQSEHHTQQQKAEAEAQPMHKFQLPKKGQAHKNPHGKTTRLTLNPSLSCGSHDENPYPEMTPGLPFIQSA